MNEVALGTQRVFKYTVPVDDHWHAVPEGPVLLVACQINASEVQVWTLDDGYPQPPMRMVRVFGTGHPLPSRVLHLGSVVTAGGNLVWHLFEDVSL